MKQYDILIEESGGREDDLSATINKGLDEAYNVGLDHSIAQITQLAKNYPGGKTESGEFFTNPTRDALNYAIELISALKKPTI